MTLSVAISSSDLETVSVLLKNGHIPSGEDFLTSCKKGHLGIVTLLLEAGVDISYNAQGGIKYAVENNHVEVTSLLLDRGANVHCSNDYLLTQASHLGSMSMVALLVERGADVRACKDSPLVYAVKNKHFEMVKFLISKGADVKADDSFVLRSASSQGLLEIVEYLLKETEVDIHALSDYSVRWAAGNGHVEVVKCLLKYGADINTGKGEESAFSTSIKNGRMEMIRFLMNSVKIDLTRNPAHAVLAAVASGNIEVLQFILDHVKPENDPTIKSVILSVLTKDIILYSGKPIPQMVEETFLRAFISKCSTLDLDVQCLNNAIERNNLGLMKFMVENGIDIKKYPHIFVHASYMGRLEIVSYLVSLGVDIHYNEDEALVSCIKGGHFKLMEQLLSLGLKVHARSDELLKLAIHKGHWDIVKLLLKHGIHTTLPKSDMALSLFVRRKAEEIMKYKDERKGSYFPADNAFYNIYMGRSPMNLKEHGIDVHFKDEAFLLLAIIYNREDHVRYYIKQGARVNAGNGMILPYTIQNLGMLKCLVENGADLKKSRDLMAQAIHYSRLDVVKFLVEQGLEIPTEIEHTIADDIYREDMERYLLERGIKVNVSKEAFFV